MDKLWNSHAGKLFVGGCGTQVGLLLTCGTLASVMLVCSVCAFANVLTLGVSQEVAFVTPKSTETAVVTVTPTPTSALVESLVGQVRLLHGEVEFLRSNMPVVALPTSTATPTPAPFVMADQSAVNLRSGPGTDYNQVGTLAYGESMKIVGRDEFANWWLVSTPNDLFAWVAANLVTAHFATDNIPVVTIPSLMVWGTPNAGAVPIAVPGLSPEGPLTAVTPQLLIPVGTPTTAASQSRQFVQEMPAYGRLTGHLLIPPVSESVSPHGDRIAITERIKLYTVTTDGALSHIWLEDTAEIGPIGNVVWSPDGDYLALVVGYKEKYCKPCEGVIILRLADGLITYLEHPGDLDLNAPRWTQDGHLLANAHPSEPADGIAYIYDLSGKGKPASGAYVLSASHVGQRWYPWIPGKTWLVGVSERADSYNAD